MPADDRHEEFVRALSEAHRPLLGYLVSLVGNRHDAEDVLQRASITLWRRFDTFERGTNFMAWAATVAFYEAKNFQRVAARERLRFSDTLVETLADERRQDFSAADERREMLEKCIAKLDAPAREIVEVAYVEEGAIAKLAGRLGRAPQTIYNRLNFIRRSLASCVEQRLAGTR